jgi:hypothetical protein
MNEIIRYVLKKYKFLHYCNIHNKDCRRRLFTKENTYICLITGNTHKKFEL